MVRFGVCGVLVACLGCEAGPCAEGTLCWAEEAIETRWGFAPETLRWADLDGDGMADLAASSASGTVTVVWGADRTLGGAATTWSVAKECAGLAVADVDGDGWPDLVTASPQSDEIAVIKNLGRREFEVGTRVAVGRGPIGVIAADLDGEGVEELVTIEEEGTVTVVRKGVATTTVVGPGPRGLAAGDVDGDGDVDVVAALADRGGLQVMLGDGKGGLTAGALHAVGAAPFAVVVEDLDGDGAVDLASADALADSVSVLFGDGKGGVREQRRWPTEREPRGLVVVPGSGLAVLSGGTGAVEVIDPVNGGRIAGAAAGRVEAMTVGDADGDGQVEVVYAAGGRIGALSTGAGVRASWLWEGVEVGGAWPMDVDGDGIDEVLALRTRESGELEYELWRGGVPTTVVGPAQAQLDAYAVVDVTGDGLRDVVVAVDDEVWTLVQAEDGSFTVGESLGMQGSVEAMAASVDAEGAGRVLIATTVAELVTVVADGSGTLAVVETRGMPGIIDRIRMVDRDGDAIDDAIVLQVDDNGAIAVEEIAVLDAMVGWSFSEFLEIRDLVAADFDGDGGVDAMMCTDEGLALAGDLLSGSFAPVRIGESRCETLALADVNSDGAMDVLVMDRSSGRGLVTPWVHVDGAWSPWAKAAIEGGEASRFARLDGDALPDVLVIQGREAMEGWRLEFGAGLKDAQIRWFDAAEEVLLADVNGDGAPDVVGRGAGMFVAPGDGDGGFKPAMRGSRELAQEGLEGFVDAVAADLEGDGRDEILAVSRRLGEWATEVRVLRFVDGAMVAEEPLLRWDTTERARLVVGDVDSDGAVDVVVWMWQSVVFHGRGDGTFAAPELLGYLPFELISGRVLDVDGDGQREIVAVVRGLVMALHSDGDGVADLRVWWKNDMTRLVFGDVNNDRRVDVLGRVDSGSTSGLVSGLALRVGDAAPRMVVPDGRVGALADVDGDGWVEVVAAARGEYQADGEATLMIGRAMDGSFVFKRRELAIGEPSAVWVRDFDGDEVVDVAVVAADGVAVVRQAR